MIKSVPRPEHVLRSMAAMLSAFLLAPMSTAMPTVKLAEAVFMEPVE